MPDQFKTLSQGPPKGAWTFPDQTIAEVAQAINRRVENFRKVLDPPAIQLESKVVETQKQTTESFALMFIPGMLYMAVLFVVQGLSADMWREKSRGTLRRQVTTPSDVRALVGGKLVAAGAVFLIVGAAGLGGMSWMAGAMVSWAPLAALWVVCSGCVLCLLLMLVQMQAATERGAQMLASFMVLPFTMLGGAFFPFEAMPDNLARIGRLTPNGWALTQFRSLIDGKVELVSLVLAWVILLVALGAAFLMAVRKVRLFAL